jgi:hypothetical protein
VAYCCEDGNEPSGYIKGRESLDYLNDYQLLKRTLLLSCLKPYF